MKIFRRSKVVVLLFVGIILYLFIYMYTAGAWTRYRYSSAMKLASLNQFPRKLQSIERDFSEIIHRAVIDHNLPRNNITNLVDRLLRVEFRVRDLKDRESGAERTQKSSFRSEDLDAFIDSVMRQGSRDEDLNDKALIKIQRKEHHKGALKPDVVAEKDTVPMPTERPTNPHNYKYLINEPQKCFNRDGSEIPVFLLVVIFTIHTNVDYRNAIRQTWGSPVEIDGMRIVTMFLMAKNSDPELNEAVLKEHELYHDILMEDFADTYRNLTYKTIMGMKWMSSYCRHAKYMFKTDDDMYANYANLVRHLNQSPSTNFVTGICIDGGPIRDPKSKWYMPKSLYNESTYPPFCTGSGYALSGDVPPRIYQTSLSTHYLYLEDVFVAICMKKLGIVPLAHPGFNNMRVKYTYCHYKTSFTASHMVKPSEMFKFWADQNSKTYEC